MANVANDGVMAEVNLMLEQMFLLETGMASCPWVHERLAAGDRLSVRVFLRRINGTLTPAEEKEMVSRVIREPLTLLNNHSRFDLM